MRYAITIGFKHGCNTPEVITGPDVAIADQKEAMRETRGQGEHEKFQRVEIWTSNQGRIARKRLATPGSGPLTTSSEETDKSPAPRKRKK